MYFGFQKNSGDQWRLHHPEVNQPRELPGTSQSPAATFVSSVCKKHTLFYSFF